jgi:peptidoglycan/xylan/chitin deacetylase (PgdA/CDA1 family)
VPRHIVCLTFDFDTMAGFIARGLTTPTPLSRGEFGARACPRILDFLESRGIRSTWFTSWAHVPPAAQSREAEEADLVRANEAILRLTGQRARGYRSPSWDLGADAVDLLVAHGFVYDSSLMGADYWPYRARRGDVVKLGEPYRFGDETALIEMPVSWSLDDFPHFEFLRTPQAVLQGLQPARAVMASWLDEFLHMKKTVDWGILTYTMHPYVIGRGYRMLALEDLADRLAREGACS